MLCFVLCSGNYGVNGRLVVCVADLPEPGYAVFGRGEHGFGDVVGTVVQHKFGDGFELLVELLVGSGGHGCGAVAVLLRLVLSSSEGEQYHQFHPGASLGFPVGRLHGKAVDECPDFSVEVGVVVVGGCALVWFGEGGFGVVGVVGVVVGENVRYGDLVVSRAFGEFVEFLLFVAELVVHFDYPAEHGVNASDGFDVVVLSFLQEVPKCNNFCSVYLSAVGGGEVVYLVVARSVGGGGDALSDVFLSGMSFGPRDAYGVEAFCAGKLLEYGPQVAVFVESPLFLAGEGGVLGKDSVGFFDKGHVVGSKVEWAIS